MSISTEQQAPLRRAALLLHALGDADRDWLLQALPPAQRQQVQPLLVELGELGMPRDARLLASGEDEAAPAPSPRRDDDWLRALDAGGIAVLARVLEGEPVQLVRAVLAMETWPWHGQLLAALSEEGRRRLREMEPGMAAGPCLRAAVLEALAPRWHAVATARSLPRPGAWSRLRASLATWRRRT